MTPNPSLRQLLRPHTWKPLRVGADRHASVLLARRAYHPARHHELAQANALKYPRIHHDDATPPMRIPVFREKFKHVEKDTVIEEEVVVHGRLQFIRRVGSGLVFLVLRGEFENLQGMCNVRRLEAAGVDCSGLRGLTQLLNRGDIISLKGKATRSSTGELTILATGLPEILSPSLVPLPFQLADMDSRVQSRHIDLLANRKSMDTLRLRSYIIKYMRDFFHERDFLEFQTPILAENAGGAIARPFVTNMVGESNPLALRIAPELWLKRLVVGGVDKVFELGPSFRNEGIDQTHNPEFTTCEFYSAYASLGNLIRLTEDLICGTAQHCQDLIATKLDSLPRIDDGAAKKFARPFRQMEFIPSLEAALGFRLPDLEAEDALDKLVSVLESKGITVDDICAPHPPILPKLLDKLAAMYIEPNSADAPLFITHHPVCMSPLSKSFVCPKTGQHVSARTELFVDGMELANMYEEENDPFAQRDKFIEQAIRHCDPSVDHEQHIPSPPPPRRGAGAEVEGGEQEDGEVPLIDESYVSALESGLPPTGGWGCGVERLVMLFAGTRRISDCLSFGNLRNVVGVSNLKKAQLQSSSSDKKDA
ncbi:hypothetical protein B0H66DRAFT_540178 [Apodospora peruviana]|uniref:Lysyl-tRNA synthetase n=1 Tax=Apodospora peruviana TaxID=516989 RepID=A0AAE0IQ32_9PEZI|nr:hypothetical protein B0H66DRAFT_540178 [Apodospora peruviana]